MGRRSRRTHHRRKPTSRRNLSIVIAISILALVLWLNQWESGSPAIEATPSALMSDSGGATYARSFLDTWPQLGSEAQGAVAADFDTANYYIVLDGSGSMKEQRCSNDRSKMDAAKEALLIFARQFPANANLGLAVFDGSGLSERLPLGRLDLQRLTGKVGAIRADGGTPLLNALDLGYSALTEQGRRQLGYGEYHLVVVTDGEANQGQDPSPMVRKILTDSPLVIHTIGFCIAGRHSLNQAGYVDYRAADDPAALQSSFAAVLAESPNFDVSEF